MFTSIANLPLANPFASAAAQKHKFSQVSVNVESPTYKRTYEKYNSMIVSDYELEYMALILEDFFDHTLLSDRVAYSKMRTKLISFMAASRQPKLEFNW